MGHVTVRTKAGASFSGGVDSLHGGETGNVASVTNYYAPVAIATLTVSANLALGREGLPLPRAGIYVSGSVGKLSITTGKPRRGKRLSPPTAPAIP
jgi:hypothetical protein